MSKTNTEYEQVSSDFNKTKRGALQQIHEMLPHAPNGDQYSFYHEHTMHVPDKGYVAHVFFQLKAPTPEAAPKKGAGSAPSQLEHTISSARI
jgi:hypothetical protein